MNKILNALTLGLFVMFSIGLVGANVEILGTVYEGDLSSFISGVEINVTCDEASIITTSGINGDFDVTFSDRNYCLAYDAVPASNSIDITYLPDEEPPVDTTAPVITLVSPENATTSDSATSNTQTINFVFNIMDESPINNCRLMIDGTEADNSSSITSPFTFTKDLTVGTYAWNIECTDGVNTGNSEARSLTLTFTPVSSSSSSGGGGGSSSSSSGGGSICTTQWTCSEWSTCSAEGSQTRTCSYPSNFCSPYGAKPTEVQDCTPIVPSGNITIEEKPKPTSGTGFLTGAVTGVGNFAKSGIGMGIIAGFLIIGGSVIFFAVKKKKKDKK
jgi:hypothetical protein